MLAAVVVAPLLVGFVQLTPGNVACWVDMAAFADELTDGAGQIFEVAQQFLGDSGWMNRPSRWSLAQPSIAHSRIAGSSANRRSVKP